MDALTVAFLGVVVLFGAAILLLEFMNYRRVVAETRPDRWAAMMHERIWTREDGTAGPP